MKEGIVIKSTGKWYTVLLDEGKQVNCRVVGKFRLKDVKLTNPIAVGDHVFVEMEKNQDTGLIKKIGPRKNYIVRQSPRKKHHLHLLAANLDQAMVIVTIRQPSFKPGFIDRFLLMTTPHDIPTAIVFNKADLYTDEDMMIFDVMRSVYKDIGHPSFLTSSLTGQGIEELKSYLKGKKTLVSGHSGVGKSTLANSVHEDLELRTQELSDYSGKGQHTTTFAEMHLLSDGGAFIDTPGIKELAFNNMEPLDIAHNFTEFFRFSVDCKYQNCLHLNEPKCAVKDAIEAGKIHEIRYHHYLKLMDETMDQNHWERKMDW